MANISLNKIWGIELKECGYKKIKVNHFEKKFKNYWLIIDFEVYPNSLMFRLLKENFFKETKCLKRIDIDNWISLTQNGFVGMIIEIESEFNTIINSQND